MPSNGPCPEGREPEPTPAPPPPLYVTSVNMNVGVNDMPRATVEFVFPNGIDNRFMDTLQSANGVTIAPFKRLESKPIPKPPPPPENESMLGRPWFWPWVKRVLFETGIPLTRFHRMYWRCHS